MDCRPTRVAAVSCQELSPLLSQGGATGFGPSGPGSGAVDMFEAAVRIGRKTIQGMSLGAPECRLSTTDLALYRVGRSALVIIARS